MPLYEYQCEACGHRFEVIQKFSDPPRAVCDKCGGVLAKLVSSPAIQFKGSGWYITDYARANKGDKADGSGSKAEGASAGESKSESATKSDSKSDSKSDAKSDTKTTETKSPSKPTTPSTSS